MSANNISDQENDREAFLTESHSTRHNMVIAV